ncbi:MAG: protein phosphatase CheZ [Burkholderiaceae bacterium]
MERSDTTIGAALYCDAAGYEGTTPRARRPRKPRARKGVPAKDVTIVGGTDAPPACEERPAPEDLHQRIGQLTRTLHDALRELGYDKELLGTREQLPDARDRLAYIARVTGEAAEKVLNAVDRARGVQEELTRQAGDLHRRWQAVAAFAAAPGRATPAGRQLVDETCEFFAGVEAQADRTNAILTDIMLAQDFHDLTGQVIRKVVALAQTMEEQLVRLLIDTTPPEQRARVEATHAAPALGGPVVNAEGRTDVVTDQSQVDDLLASLGF